VTELSSRWITTVNCNYAHTQLKPICLKESFILHGLLSKQRYGTNSCMFNDFRPRRIVKIERINFRLIT
jgi:hypothetical protein